MILSDCFDYVLLAYHTVFHHLAPSLLSSVGISHLSLPSQVVFPGPWEACIRAPVNKSHIPPSKIWHVQGSVSAPGAVLDSPGSNSSTTILPGGLVIFEFSENIAGR